MSNFHSRINESTNTDKSTINENDPYVVVLHEIISNDVYHGRIYYDITLDKLVFEDKNKNYSNSERSGQIRYNFNSFFFYFSGHFEDVVIISSKATIGQIYL